MQALKAQLLFASSDRHAYTGILASWRSKPVGQHLDLIAAARISCVVALPGIAEFWPIAYMLSFMAENFSQLKPVGHPMCKELCIPTFAPQQLRRISQTLHKWKLAAQH